MKNVKEAVEEGAKKKSSNKKIAKNNEDFKKFRWFETSSRKIVVGGKNAEQNEFLVKQLINSVDNYIVMHTNSPGSPFAIIPSESPNEIDLEETAIFTASFSRAWKAKAKNVRVDIFKASSIYKTKSMKIGTFGVKKLEGTKIVSPKLYITTQKSVIRAVPQEKKNSIILIPGNLSKDHTCEQIAEKLKVTKQEVEMALPSGEFKIVK